MVLVDLVLFEDLEEISIHSKRLGNQLVIVGKSFKDLKELDEFRKKIEKTKFQFKACHVLKEESTAEAKRFRDKADFLAVKGGTTNANNFAVKTRGIDFLLQPISSEKLTVDTGTTRLAAENGVAIAFLFSSYLNPSSYNNSLLYRNTFMTVKLMKRFKANALFFSGATNLGELRSARDLESFAVLLGFSLEQAKRFVERFTETIFEKTR